MAGAFFGFRLPFARRPPPAAADKLRVNAGQAQLGFSGRGISAHWFAKTRMGSMRRNSGITKPSRFAEVVAWCAVAVFGPWLQRGNYWRAVRSITEWLGAFKVSGFKVSGSREGSGASISACPPRRVNFGHGVVDDNWVGGGVADNQRAIRRPPLATASKLRVNSG